VAEGDRTTTARTSWAQARGYLQLIVIAALIGIPAALLAAAFLAAVHETTHLLWTDLPEKLGHDQAPWYLVLGLPVLGGLIVWVARRFLPGDGGHNPNEGLNMSPTPWRYAPGVALAAFGTLAFGAVLGPEAPLIALGSIVGMAATSLVKVPARAQQVVATSGSFSAVSALFGGPLVAGILMLEAGVAAGAALLPVLIPGVVAAAVGYVLFVGLGDWGGLSTAGLTLPDLPAYDGTSVLDLALSIPVGVVAAIAMTQVHQLSARVERLSARVGMLWALVGGGLAVGLLAQGARSISDAVPPEILFSGQAAIPDLFTESTGALVVILVAKALGYAVCLGCGFRGGPVFPAVFLGVLVAMFAVVWFDVSTTWAVAVGTAAGMAAGTGLLFSALLLSLLLVGLGGQDAIPAAVLAATAAWLTRAALSGKWPGADPAPQAE
jgi:H+/Cl- antiporter ClcA